MKHLQNKNKLGIAAASVAALGLAGGLWWHGQPRHAAHARMVYSVDGYGGFVPAPVAPRPAVKAAGPNAPVTASVPSEQAAEAAYAAGRYQDVESAAAQVLRQAAQQPTLPHRQAAAHAGSLLAYAAARRHDLPLARVRFAAAQKEAARLPDKGKPKPMLGQREPATLEEDDAFQHAVCTGALGNTAADKRAAEGEYVAFMRRFPASPLLPAAVKRIARMYGGNIPPADEAVWQGAMQIAQKQQKARMREASLCGPECLAELLRRHGQSAAAHDEKTPDKKMADKKMADLVHALAQEMKTSDRGTSLAALASAATHHGFAVQGLALTQAGLMQTLAERRQPVIAFIFPGHYVLVEAASAAGVHVWDPDANGIGRGGRREVAAATWQQEWRGVTLVLAPATQLLTLNHAGHEPAAPQNTTRHKDDCKA